MPDPSCSVFSYQIPGDEADTRPQTTASASQTHRGGVGPQRRPGAGERTFSCFRARVEPRKARGQRDLGRSCSVSRGPAGRLGLLDRPGRRAAADRDPAVGDKFVHAKRQTLRLVVPGQPGTPRHSDLGFMETSSIAAAARPFTQIGSIRLAAAASMSLVIDSIE